MANKTIYGCRNKTTGVITFEGEACDSGNYVGCRVKSGIHAGQIAVTILEDHCDDIYYGCRSKTTGKFQVIIPDDCCRYYNPVEWNCYCFTSGKTPLYYTMEISGVRSCPDKNGSNVNGIHKLTYDEGDSDPLGVCVWKKVDGLLLISLTFMSEDGLLGITASWDWGNEGTALFVEENGISCETSGSRDNQYAEEDCVPADHAGYDGSVSWCPFWNPTGCP